MSEVMSNVNLKLYCCPVPAGDLFSYQHEKQNCFSNYLYIELDGQWCFRLIGMICLILYYLMC